jgi:membrane dipeptidase
MAQLNRRQFITLAAGVAATAARADVPAAVSPGVGAAGAALYRKSFVLDCNTLASIGAELCCSEETAPALKLMRESGISAMKTTLGASHGTFEETVADVAAAQNLVDRFPGQFIKVNRVEDLDRARREHKIALIFSFEAATMLEDKLDRIELFRNAGVRVMQLSYNHKSPFGYGCLDGDSDGLTDLGRQAVERMNKLGVALDLSHSNARTTADGIAASSRPPLITHAGCRAVYAHPRNKEDRELKALADKGGVMGVYMLPFLTEDTRQPLLADYMQHLVHALEVCGEDHVGIGTDVPFFAVGADDLKAMAKDSADRVAAGVAAPGENRPPYIPDLNTPRKLELVADALLKHGYSARVAEKVLGLNFRRAFQDIWAA